MLQDMAQMVRELKRGEIVPLKPLVIPPWLEAELRYQDGQARIDRERAKLARLPRDRN